MEEQIEVVVKEIISQQTNSNGKPIIELYKGDIVQKREDGIYLIRKIEDFSENVDRHQSTFDGIKKENSY